MLLSDCIKSFLRYELVIGSTEKTVLHYSNTLRVFQKFIFEDFDINDIHREDYEDYILSLRNKKIRDDKKLSTVSIRTYYKGSR